MITIPTKKTPGTLDRALQSGGNLVSKVEQVALFAPVAFAMRNEFLRNRVLRSALVRRKVRGAVLAKLGWAALPAAGLALAYFGIRALRRNVSAEANGESTRGALPSGEKKGLADRVDESSWESFPASDPPAF